MVSNILLPDPPSPLPGPLGSKGQNSTFSEHGHVAYQIKGDHECSDIVANIPPTPPWGWGQYVKSHLFHNRLA